MITLRPICLPVFLALLFTGCSVIEVDTSVQPNLDRQILITFTAAPEKPQQARSFAAEEPAPSKSRIRRMIASVLRFHGLRRIADWSIDLLGLHVIVAEVGEQESMDKVVSKLKQDSRVESVQSVGTFKLLTYNDPYFHLQNAVNSDEIERIHEWATGKGVVVGVVDTGVDRNHPELREKIIYAENFVDHDQQNFDNDEHGTAVAGVIASTAGNKVGIVGIAPDVKLMAFKACWQRGKYRNEAVCDSFSLAKALYSALVQQPDVLNLSLAGPEDPLIRLLIKTATDLGIIVIAAVESKKGSESFPASMDEVIAVSAAPVDELDETIQNGVLAPGIDILTTSPGGSYSFKSGRSMATAYVSAVIALMKEREPRMSGYEARNQMVSTARSSVKMIPVVDVCAAVSDANKGEICPSNVFVSNLDFQAQF